MYWEDLSVPSIHHQIVFGLSSIYPHDKSLFPPHLHPLSFFLTRQFSSLFPDGQGCSGQFTHVLIILHPGSVKVRSSTPGIWDLPLLRPDLKKLKNSELRTSGFTVHLCCRSGNFLTFFLEKKERES